MGSTLWNFLEKKEREERSERVKEGGRKGTWRKEGWRGSWRLGEVEEKGWNDETLASATGFGIGRRREPQRGLALEIEADYEFSGGADDRDKIISS